MYVWVFFTLFDNLKINRMNKLELKHLAPYLPYGLKLYHKGFPYVEMRGLPESFQYDYWNITHFFTLLYNC